MHYYYHRLQKDDLKKAVEENEKQMKSMQQSYEKKLAEAKAQV